MLIVGPSVPAAARTAWTTARSGDCPGVDQHPDAVQPGERVQHQLGAAESFLPQADPRPEALQSGRHAEGGRIQWLGHLPFFAGARDGKITLPTA